MRDLQMAAIRQETRELEAVRVRQVNRATRPVVPLDSCLACLESCAMPGLEFLVGTQG